MRIWLMLEKSVGWVGSKDDIEVEVGIEEIKKIKSTYRRRNTVTGFGVENAAQWRDGDGIQGSPRATERQDREKKGGGC